MGEYGTGKSAELRGDVSMSLCKWAIVSWDGWGSVMSTVAGKSTNYFRCLCRQSQSKLVIK